MAAQGHKALEMDSDESLEQDVLINSWLTVQVELHPVLEQVETALSGDVHRYWL